MKKRIVQIILFCICLLLIPKTAVFAHEKESLESFVGTEELWNQLPEELQEEEVRALFDESRKDSFLQTVMKSILSLFSLGIRNGTQFFAKLCGLLILAALFRAVKDSFGLKGLESAFDFLFFLGLALTCYYALKDCVTLTTASIQGIQAFFLTALPITTVLLTLSGSPGTAATTASSLSFTLAAASTFVSSLLAPLFNTLFAFSVCDGILDGGLNSFLAFIKKTLKTLCILFFTLVSASLALQNALATAADSVAMRSVRFAAGNFIPVIGSLVGESSKILAASFASVKAECGVLCILVLAYVLLRPILCIAVQKLFLNFAGSFAEIVGEKSILGFFKALSGLLDLLMALMISQGCYLIFYITLFLTNQGGL